MRVRKASYRSKGMLNKALIGLPTLDLIPLRLPHSSEDQMVAKVL